MHNFFVKNNQINGKKASIIGEDVNHIKNVLKMNKGERTFICDEDGNKYVCEIEKIDNEKVDLNILEKAENTENKVKISLFQGIPKFDKMDMIIQKCTELGAYEFYPVQMKYCISKIKDEEKRNTRWQKIVASAAEQSKRNIIPKVNYSIKFDELVSKIKDYDLAIICYENEEKTTIKELLENEKYKDIKNVCIIVGPEGGISEEEYDKLTKENAKSASLGKLILRTETAGIVGISMLNYKYNL